MRVMPMAKRLALEYRIVKAVEARGVASYREAARWMGVSHARAFVL